MQYCRVIVDGTPFVNEEGFVYRVPDYLTGHVAIGSLVYVPFGKKNSLKKGFVIADETTVEEKVPIKDVCMVASLFPVITPEMMDLCRFVADYYACALNYCLKQIVPKYMMNNPFVAVRNRVDGNLYLLTSSNNILAAADLCAAGDGELVLYQPLQRHQEKYVALADKADVSVEDMRQALRRAPKQRALLEYLYEFGGQSETDLKEKFGAMQAPLAALEKRGFITILAEAPEKQPLHLERDEDSPVMNPAQQKIFDALREQQHSHTYHKNLINGVTGSGKTLIYERLADEILAAGRQVLILVPEITLSYHLFAKLKGHFGARMALLHSQLSEKARYEIWEGVRDRAIDIVLGPRSALFLPFTDLGLIVIDEEHESSYKQSEPDPRYHAMKVAEYLANRDQGILLLGSATPSIDTLYDVVQKKCHIFNLKERANHSKLPQTILVDMREERREGHYDILSRSLTSAIKDALSKKEQVILLINKKGYSSSVFCHECGAVLHCPKCDIPLTYYKSGNELKCNYCEFHMPMVSACPECGSQFLEKRGIGTETLEESCAQAFPDATIARLDAQSLTDASHREKIFADYEAGNIDILVGTQLLAKGIDFNNTTCIGVVNADITLNLPDYRSAERCFQLMVQVAGRAGRDKKEGRVFIQTYQPEHYALVDACAQNVHQFFLDEMDFRKKWLYPPVISLCRIIASDYSINNVEYSMKTIYNYIENLSCNKEIMGPAFAPLSKKNNRFRMHLLIKAGQIDEIQWMMKKLRQDMKHLGIKPTTRVLIDIEPENIF
ncbi:MAG: primosomal protein N' [Peptococcaceae bacterium]|nr:primosomal protein N' [Peptococcaceae bacterium]